MYKCMPSSPGSIAGMPSSQALPDYLITRIVSECVPAVLSALAVWIQGGEKKTLPLVFRSDGALIHHG